MRSRLGNQMDGKGRNPSGDSDRLCDWPNCTNLGEFRAPWSPSELRRYRWFCLEHVRRYNATWNYYDGMSDDEVEADVRADTVWRRPSWRVGTANGGRPIHGMRDPFGLFGEEAEAPPPLAESNPAQQAMTVLDLHPPVTVATVKARYKELVKRHHPDANGGDKDAEERFKQIHEAYRTVMESISPPRTDATTR